MPAAAKPQNETDRLKALYSYQVLDTEHEEAYNDLVELASRICDVPIALISLVDANRQWFKARVGIDADETHRDLAFCGHAILESDELLIVEDATKDKRFSDNTLVTEDPNIRFYAGCPLVNEDGFALGTLCVIDQKPQTLSADQEKQLRLLGKHVVYLLENHKKQFELERKNQSLELAERVAGLGHWHYDLIMDQLSWSEQIYEIHGVTPDAYSPEIESAIAFYHEEDRDMVKRTVEECIKHKTPFEFYARLVTPDGIIKEVLSRGAAQQDRAGNTVSLFGIFQDVSEQKQKDLAYQESKKFLELILNSMPNYVFVKDKDFRIVECNEAFKELYPEEKQDQIIGYTTLEDYKQEEVDEFLIHDRTAFEIGQSETMETINFPNGMVRTLFTQKTRFENALGDPYILCMAYDVTEREALIEQLTRSNEELERFAYVASHDLQEPLRMVTSFTELLKQKYGDQLDENGKKYIQFAHDSAHHMQALIKDLLAYAKLSDDERLNESVDLNETADHVLEMLGEMIKQHDADIKVDALPVVQHNGVRLSRILQNLIGNGIKYQPATRKPELHVSSEETENDWIIHVQDNGIGIDEQHLTTIFQPFKRLHTSREYAGTGMGLAICQKILEASGGRIWVTSEKDKGSRFSFSIPKQLPNEQSSAA